MCMIKMAQGTMGIKRKTARTTHLKDQKKLQVEGVQYLFIYLFIFKSFQRKKPTQRKTDAEKAEAAFYTTAPQTATPCVAI